MNAFRPAEETYIEQGINGHKTAHEDTAKRKMELLNHEMLLLISCLAEKSYYASALSTG